MDWNDILPREIKYLTEMMLDATDVPQYASDEFYRDFNSYIYKEKNDH